MKLTIRTKYYLILETKVQGQISQTFDFKEVELLQFTLRSPVNSK